MLHIEEIHQVSKDMVHLVVQANEQAGEWVCLIEGGGVCLGNSFREWKAAEKWVRGMFGRLFPDHRCDLGCIRMPHAEFCADDDVLNRLASI